MKQKDMGKKNKNIAFGLDTRVAGMNKLNPCWNVESEPKKTEVIYEGLEFEERTLLKVIGKYLKKFKSK